MSLTGSACEEERKMRGGEGSWVFPSLLVTPISLLRYMRMPTLPFSASVPLDFESPGKI